MLLTVTERASSFGQFMIVLFLFVVVLFVTLWTTRWVAGYQKEKMTGSNIEIIDTMRISNNKYIQVVRLGEKYVAIAVCKDTVTMLSEIPEEQIHRYERTEAETVEFKDLLEKAKNIHLKNTSNNTGVLGKKDKEDE